MLAMTPEQTHSLSKDMRRMSIITRQFIKDGFCLLVEDNIEVGTCVAKFLENKAIKSRIKTTATEAIDMINEDSKRIICVVVDLYLDNNENGEEVIKLLEQNYRSIPYVVFTGNLEEADRIKRVYPQAQVVTKNGDIRDLIVALGLTA